MAPKSHIALEPGVKVAVQMPPEPTEAELQFAQQMGVKYTVLWGGVKEATYDYYMGRREVFEAAGIQIYGASHGVSDMDAIILNLPNRDERIEDYKRNLREMGRAGIPYTTHSHVANGVWCTPNEQTRGGAPARAFDETRLGEAVGLDGKPKQEGLSHGRTYSEAELWDYYEHFVKQIGPAAEDAGVMVGIHPDDPPGIELGGIPRNIFSSFDGFKRALEVTDSPNIGMCLCTGCWLEGGKRMGKDVIETVKYFSAQEKIFEVHFRTVNQPLPHFTEAFIDDGYFDMYKVVKALTETGFRGVLIPDHIPLMAGDARVGTAYSIAYMKAMQRRAQEETR